MVGRQVTVSSIEKVVSRRYGKPRLWRGFFYLYSSREKNYIIFFIFLEVSKGINNENIEMFANYVCTY